MHRDYSITGTQISVEVHDDRVEIANPGDLPKGMSIQNLGKVSIRRNELIADLFFRMHKVERFGLGIQKMKEAMLAAGLREPVFEPGVFFRASFQRSPELALKKHREQSVRRFGEKFGEGFSRELESELGSQLESELESLELRVLAALVKHPLGKASLAIALGQKQASGPLHRIIRSLLARKLIERSLPQKPASRLQKYLVTKAGEKLLRRKE